MNELGNPFYSLIDTKDLMKAFYKIKDQYIYYNEFFEIDARNIIFYYDSNDFNEEVHNVRKEEWTQIQHEKRIAYLIRHFRFKAHASVEIDVDEIESNLYDLMLVDGYHRLAAAFFGMVPQVYVKAKDKYTLDLAEQILLEVQ